MKLLLGGSPCTHWSIAKSQNRETQPEGLGWELFRNYLIAKERYKPQFFLYENNKSIASAIQTQITRELGVAPILINSALVSAQNRQRLYWTNIPGVEQPQDRGLVLMDVLDSGIALREKSYTLKANYAKASTTNALDGGHFPAPMAIEPVNEAAEIHIRRLGGFYGQCSRWGIYDVAGKAPTLTASAGMGGGHVPMYPIRLDGITGDGGTRTQIDPYVIPASTTGVKIYPVYEVKGNHITMRGKQYPIKLPDGFYMIRKLTVTECKRLQTVPEKYIFPVSDSQAYKMLGNGWTVDVIAHILHYVPGISNEPLEVLSMYDGMSCGHLALDKLGARITLYCATEIDKFAIKTTQTNFPDTVQLGDAFQVRKAEWWSFLDHRAKNQHIQPTGTMLMAGVP